MHRGTQKKEDTGDGDHHAVDLICGSAVKEYPEREPEHKQREAYTRIISDHEFGW